MKLHKVTGNTPYALHGANKLRILTIVEMADEKILYGGIPALLTDGAGWYSAELMAEDNERLLIAYAVNGYKDKGEARRDAERRA
jgi:hypothetical protein